MFALYTQLVKLWKDEDGPTAVEYSVLVALVVLAALVTIALLGTGTQGTFNSIGTWIMGGPTD